MKNTAESIKKLRKKYGLTQAELGEIAGLSSKAVGAWESGRAEPRIGVVEKIAAYLGIPKSDVLGWDGTEDEDLTDSTYFLDPEVAEMVQELHDNHDLRIIFDATRKASKEDIQFIKDMITRMGLNE